MTTKAVTNAPTTAAATKKTFDLLPDEMPVREALALYYRVNGFPPDGGDSELFVKLPMGPFRLWLPNLPPRKRAVKLHDLHHVVTGYQTDWPGELAISGYEVGAGCGPFWMAWLINSGGMGTGLLTNPASVFRAFARGRASDTLYHHVENGRRFDDVYGKLLDEKLGTLRARLRLVDEAVPTGRDKAAAIAFGVLGALAHLAPVVVVGWALVVWAFG